MAAKASPSPSSASSSASSAMSLPVLRWWMAGLLTSLISFLTSSFSNSSPIRPLPWKARSLFASAISFVTGGAHKTPLNPSPPLPWTTRLFASLVSILSDAMRRPDGTVRRFLSRFDITVDPNAIPVNGVSTADVDVDPSRDLWFRLFMPSSSSSSSSSTLRGNSGGKLPVVVFFHGGGFAFLSPASQAYDAVCRRICREFGVAIVSVNYRLSPEHRCPAPYDDGVDVLRFLDCYSSSDSRKFRRACPTGNLLHLFFDATDLSNCFVAGDSAGANIAHHVARRWTARKQPLEEGRVRLSGLFALQPFFGGEERTKSEVRLAGAPIVNMERTDWLWRAFLPEDADRDHEAANPAAAAAGLGEDFPPSVVVVGGFDPLQDWQRRYYESLKKMGKETTLLEYPDAIHGFFLLPGQTAAATPLMEEIGGFIQRHSTPCVVRDSYRN